MSLSEPESQKIFVAAKEWLAADAVREAQRKAALPPSRSALTRRVCRLKITLRGIRPPVWRRLEVIDDTTLARLHRILQPVMGWTDSHLHAFQVGDEQIGVPDPEWGEVTNEKKVRLRDLVQRGVKRFSYQYDFGDGWEHEVVIERTGERDADAHYPRCLAGKRACPPEDCGGVPGYQELLYVLAHPRHPEFSHLCAWAGGWRPETFDLQAVNRWLAKVR